MPRIHHPGRISAATCEPARRLLESGRAGTPWRLRAPRTGSPSPAGWCETGPGERNRPRRDSRARGCTVEAEERAGMRARRGSQRSRGKGRRRDRGGIPASGGLLRSHVDASVVVHEDLRVSGNRRREPPVKTGNRSGPLRTTRGMLFRFQPHRVGCRVHRRPSRDWTIDPGQRFTRRSDVNRSLRIRRIRQHAHESGTAGARVVVTRQKRYIHLILQIRITSGPRPAAIHQR